MSTSIFNQHSFQEHLSNQKLMASHCLSCNALHLPPRSLCPDCYGSDFAWEEAPATGKLVAFTSIAIAPTAMIAAGYGRDNPYCSGIVELDNGLRISAQILGVDASHPEEIAIGTQVQAAFVERGQGEQKKVFLVFQEI